MIKKTKYEVELEINIRLIPRGKRTIGNVSGDKEIIQLPPVKKTYQILDSSIK